MPTGVRSTTALSISDRRLAVPVQIPVTPHRWALTRLTFPVLPSHRQASAVPLEEPGTARATCETAMSRSENGRRARRARVRAQGDARSQDGAAEARREDLVAVAVGERARVVIDAGSEDDRLAPTVGKRRRELGRRGNPERVPRDHIRRRSSREPNA